jgi:hypothetical protein
MKWRRPKHGNIANIHSKSLWLLTEETRSTPAQPVLTTFGCDDTVSPTNVKGHNGTLSCDVVFAKLVAIQNTVTISVNIRNATTT